MLPKLIHIISNKEEEIFIFKKRYEKYFKIPLMIWDTKSIILLLEKYPKIYSVYNNVDNLSGFIHSKSIQILLSSFLILKEYGGIYYETDLNCFQFINKILSQKESNLISIMKSPSSTYYEKIQNFFIYMPNLNYKFLALQKQHPIWEEVLPIIENSNSKYIIQDALTNKIKENNYPVYIYDCENNTFSFINSNPTKSTFWLQIFLFVIVIIIIIIVEKINRYNLINFNLSSFIPGITNPYPPSSSSFSNSNSILINPSSSHLPKIKKIFNKKKLKKS